MPRPSFFGLLKTRLSEKAFRLAMTAGLSLPFAPPASALTPPQGEERIITSADLKPRPSLGSTHNEFWTYQFLLQDGMLLHLNFSRANLGGLKDPVCGMDLSLIGFRGRSYRLAREYDKAKFSFSEAEGELKVHEQIGFKGRLPHGQEVKVRTVKKGISYLVDLRLSEISLGKAWGDGMFKLGSSRVGLFIIIPKAKVEGLIAINDDTLRVSGTAYLDHSFQSDLAPKILSRGYRYVSHAGREEVGCVLSPKGGEDQVPLGYGLRRSGTEWTLMRPASLKTLGSANALGVSAPTRVEISFSGGEKLTLGRSSDLERFSVLSEFNGLEKFAVRQFMGGEILNFRGFGQVNDAQRAFYNLFIVKR